MTDSSEEHSEDNNLKLGSIMSVIDLLKTGGHPRDCREGTRSLGEEDEDRSEVRVPKRISLTHGLTELFFASSTTGPLTRWLIDSLD